MSQTAADLELETTSLDQFFAMPGPAPVRRRVSMDVARKDRTHGSVFIRDHAALHRVDCGGIRLLRAYGNYVEVQTSLRRFMLRNSLSDVLAQLNDLRFVQVNRSIVVNIDRVVRVDRDVVQVDEDLITLSRLCRPALLQRLRVLNGA